jgi:hypothetical protein
MSVDIVRCNVLWWRHCPQGRVFRLGPLGLEVDFIGLLVAGPGKSTVWESNDWWSAAGEKRAARVPSLAFCFFGRPRDATSCTAAALIRLFGFFETLSFPGRLSHNSKTAAQTTRHDRNCVSSSAEEREASKPIISKQSTVTQRALALVHSFANLFGMIYTRSIQVLVYFALG